MIFLYFRTVKTLPMTRPHPYRPPLPPPPAVLIRVDTCDMRIYAFLETRTAIAHHLRGRRWLHTPTTAHYSLLTANSSYTFSAKEKDSETGLSYFGSRYYSSDLSVWLSVDPMSDSIPYMTPYNYCKNSPIVMKDPNGEFPVETIWDIANVVYDVGAAVVNHIKGDHAAAKSNWKNLAFDAAAMFIPYVPAGASKAVGFMLKGFKPLEKCVVGGKTFNKMDDFYESVVNFSEGEKVLKYKEVGKQVADKNGWSKNVYLSKKNKRDVYTDKKGNIYSLDTYHGEFEIFDKRGKHKGAVNFNGYKAKDPDSNKYKINL